MEYHVEIRLPRDRTEGRTAEQVENETRSYAWRQMIGGIMAEHPRFRAASLRGIEHRHASYHDDPIWRFVFDITI